MRKTALLSISIAACAAAISAARPVRHSQKDPWAPLQFLVGSWTGEGSGKTGDAAAGKASFAFDLDKKVIVRRNRAEFPPKPGEAKGAVHEDLMVIYPQSGAAPFRAVYFDSEGHVINYDVSVRDGSAVFESQAVQNAPRFRLTYDRAAGGAVATEFAIAPPGGEFKSYVKGTMKRAD